MGRINEVFTRSINIFIFVFYAVSKLSSNNFEYLFDRNFFLDQSRNSFLGKFVRLERCGEDILQSCCQIESFGGLLGLFDLAHLRITEIQEHFWVDESNSLVTLQSIFYKLSSLVVLVLLHVFRLS